VLTALRSSRLCHVGRQGLQPRAELAGFGPWEAAIAATARVIEQARGTRNGRRVRWSWPESSPWPRAKGGPS
jgi:hypothetical protein